MPQGPPSSRYVLRSRVTLLLKLQAVSVKKTHHQTYNFISGISSRHSTITKYTATPLLQIPLSKPSHLTTTNLALRNRLDPRKRQINRDSNNPNNPKHLPIIHPIIPKDNRKDNASKVATSASDTTDDAVGERMDVRYQSEVRAVAGFEEEGHAGDEAEHCGVRFGVGDPDGDEEGATDDG